MLVQVNRPVEGMVEIGFSGDWEWLWSPLLDAGEASQLTQWLTAWVNDRPDYAEMALAQGCFILEADDAYVEVTLPAYGEDGRLTLSPHMADQLAHLLATGEREPCQPLRLQ